MERKGVLVHMHSFAERAAPYRTVIATGGDPNRALFIDSTTARTRP